MTTIEQLKENTENFKPLQITGKVRQVNPDKEDTQGNKYQIAFIEDGTGDLKVKIKNQDLFIHPSIAGNGSVTIRATKGPKNIPVGVVYLAEKEMLVVSDGAEMIYFTPDEIKKEEPVKKEKAKKEKPAVISEPYPPLTEKSEVIEVTNDEGIYAYDVIGPSDQVIYEEFLERAHIYRLIKMFNNTHNGLFPQEHLLPMTTSILIDARRANAKILDHSKKNKQVESPKPTKAPQVITPSKIEPAPSTEKKEEQETIALKTELLRMESEKHNDTQFYSALDLKGETTIGAVFQDNERRPKMIKWAYSMAKKKLPDNKKAVRDNIFAMVSSFNKYDRVTLIQEAMMHAVADWNGYEFNFDKENKFFTRLDAKVNEIVAVLLGDEQFDPHNAAIKFFTGEHDMRLEEPKK